MADGMEVSNLPPEGAAPADTVVEPVPKAVAAAPEAPYALAGRLN